MAGLPTTVSRVSGGPASAWSTAVAQPLRRLAEKGVAGTLSAISRRTKKRVAVSIAAALQLLPAETLARIKPLISPVTRLDYDRETIFLQVESEQDVLRAGECHKEPETVRWIEAAVQAGDVFYDVGSNVGAFAMVAAKQAPGKVIVHAFEPSFSTYHQLCNNVLLNDLQYEVFPHLLALAGLSGTSVFNYRSLVAGSALHTVGASVDQCGSEFEPIYQQRLLVFSLDDLVFNLGFEMPNHIKIDVDGIEYEILEGAEKVLADLRLRTLLIEVSHERGLAERIHQLMLASGFDRESEVFSPRSSVSNCVYTRGGS